jgi:hypothetical protein
MKRCLLIVLLLLVAADAFPQAQPKSRTKNFQLKQYAQGANPSADSLNWNWARIDSAIQYAMRSWIDTLRVYTGGRSRGLWIGKGADTAFARMYYDSIGIYIRKTIAVWFDSAAARFPGGLVWGGGMTATATPTWPKFTVKFGSSSAQDSLRFLAGTNISFSLTGNSLTINSSAGGAADPDSALWAKKWWTANQYAPLSHTQAQSTITSLADTLGKYRTKADTVGLTGTPTINAMRDSLGDLRTTIDGKAATSHTQAISTVTVLQDSLTAKLNRSEYSPGGAPDSTLWAKKWWTANQYAPLSHTQAQSTITSLADTLGKYRTKADTVGLTGTPTINAMRDSLGDLRASIDGKAATSHNQAQSTITNLADTLGKYRTKADTVGLTGTPTINAMRDSLGDLRTTIDGKAATSHNQAISTVTGAQDSLTAKLNRGEATTLLATKWSKSDTASSPGIPTINRVADSLGDLRTTINTKPNQGDSVKVRKLTLGTNSTAVTFDSSGTAGSYVRLWKSGSAFYMKGDTSAASGGNIVVKVKAADETVGGSTLQDDDDFQFAIGASEVWGGTITVMGTIAVTEDASVGAINCGFSVPTSATYVFNPTASFAYPDNTAVVWFNNRQPITTSYAIEVVSYTSSQGTMNFTLYITFRIANSTNSGTVKFQWAGNYNVTFYKGSTMIAGKQ